MSHFFAVPASTRLWVGSISSRNGSCVRPPTSDGATRCWPPAAPLCVRAPAVPTEAHRRRTLAATATV